MVEGAVLLDRLDEDHVADVPRSSGTARGAQAAVVVAHPRPARVGKAEEIAVAASGTSSTPMRAELSPIERITAGCQPAMSRGTSAPPAPARQLASSAGSKVAGSISRDRPAVDLDPAVVLFEPVAQRLGRGLLELRIDGGADGEAAGEELLVAELGRELAADLVGEIVARRQLAQAGGKLAALDRHQVLGLGGLGRVAGDVAVLGHLLEHVVAPGDGARLLAHRMQDARRLRQRREIGGLGEGELVERLAEVDLRRGGHAIGVLAEEDLVEIELEDLVLAQRVLEPGGEDDLLDLALAGAVAGQQEVLHHLLGDRRGAAQAAAVHARIVDRGDDAARVEAVVLVEVLVLGRDEGLLHQVGDLVDRGEDPPLAGELVHEDALARVDRG